MQLSAGLFCIVLSIASLSPPRASWGGPVNPDPVILSQPDGTQFWARHYGDEWSNGTETLDGFTILRDRQTGIWKYAEKTLAGELIPSAAIVAKDVPIFLSPRIRADSVGDSASHAAGFEPGPAAAPQLGSRPTLIILAQFLNRTAQTTAATWASKVFGASNSVKAHYLASSYGQFTLTPVSEAHGTADDGIVGWLTLNSNHPNTASNTGVANQQLTRDALIAADPFVNFAAYDINNDGMISPEELLVIVIAAGNETSFGGATACSPSIWGHKWQIFNVTPPILDGKSVGGRGYGQFGEMHCRNSNPPGNPATIGIIAHETGHLLGLPDLYDADGSSAGIGKWSLMAAGSWNGASGDSPALLDPWSKYFLGWVVPTLVTGSLIDQSLPASATSSTLFKFLNGSPTGGGEYFLIENRQQSGFDAALPGAGLLVWHVSEDQATNRNECIPGGTPACSSSVHYKVALVQADNVFHLERNQSQGDSGDPYPGANNNRALTDGTAPSTRLYSGATSGISITNISNSGPTMTATLSVGGAALTPVLSVTPNTQDFGNVAIGASADRMFVVQNAGAGTLTGSATTSAPFSIVSNANYSLGAGASQNVTVRFVPTSAASFSGNVSFGMGGGTPISRSVSGIGGPSSPCISSITPGITVSGSLDDSDCAALTDEFFKADLYTFSGGAGQITQIRMQAPSSFVDTYLTLFGPGGDLLTSNDDCDFTVGDISSCIVDYLLPSTGTYTIEASSFDAAARGAYSLALTFPGSPTLTVTPALQDFGVVPVGGTTDRTFTVQNTGTGVLIGSATVAPPFSVVSGGSYSLVAGASHTVTLRFSPTGSGLFSNTVSFSNGGASDISRSVVGSTSAVACSTAGLGLNGTLGGNLSSTDCDAPHRPGARADNYTFVGTAGQVIDINMGSTAFDTFIYLLSPAGSLLASNNDCPGLHTLDSCITNFTIPANGIYTIESTSLDSGATGSYTINLRAGRKVTHDFDGDGKSDIAVYRGGLWIAKKSSGGVMATQFGGGTDVPAEGDYDGDGKVDVAVYRGGLWIVEKSSGGVTAMQFGGGSDVPVPADYDGDGRVDIAVYRNGLWIYQPSSGGANVAIQFGGGSDVPVPADYNGDGKTDVAVYRNGLWIYHPSSGGANVGVFFGGGADVPVPADYDGDGKTDIAVYRNGLWIYQTSSDGATVAVPFGGGTDVPLN